MGHPTHIGDLRALLVPDLIRRLAERHGLRVILLQTVLDVDRRSAATDTDPASVEHAFQHGLATLNIHPPTYRPRASECTDLTTDLIGRLLDGGHAYRTQDGSVFFDGQRPSGPTVADADWALWTAPGEGDTVALHAPWSAGFPAPNVACSAASLHYLGGVVDVHTADVDASGGPHVERERAELGAVTGQEAVRHWVHVQRPTVEGRDPSEYVIQLSDLEDHGLDPLALRLALLEHGYHQQQDLTWSDLLAADQNLARWRTRVAEWAESPSAPMCAEYVERMHDAFDDNLDTQAALGILGELERDAHIPAGSKFEAFVHMDRMVGLDLARDIGKR